MSSVSLPVNNMDTRIFSNERYTYYDILNSKYPVYWNKDVNAYLISRYEDVSFCMRSPSFTTERLIAEKMETLCENESAFFVDIVDVISTWMIYNDKPTHTRLRKYMNRAFMKAELDSVAPEVGRLTQLVIDRVKASDSPNFDFVKDIAHPLPAMILCKMLGLHEDHVDTFIRWSDDIAAFMQNFVVSPTPDKDIAATTKMSMREMFTFLRETIENRRSEPQNDLISRLVHAKDIADEDRLSDAEIAAQVIHLIFGGHKIPQFMLSNTLHSLFNAPHVLSGLREGTISMDAVISESMRFEGPIQFITRHVAEDIVIAGTPLKKGDSIFLMLGSANRDSRAFPEPHVFNPNRKGNKHVAFGGGHHSCIGAAFVGLEMNIIFSRLLSEFPVINPKYNLSEPQWTDNPTFHGITTMPVEVTFK